MVIFAHSLSEAPETTWESLDHHATNVASVAGGFAARFDAGPWGAAAGWLHDLGKATPEFQAYLRGGRQAPHSGEGAKAALARYGEQPGAFLAPGIAGHHAGLPNGRARANGGRPPTPLSERLKQAQDVAIPEAWDLPESLPNPPRPRETRVSPQYSSVFFTRMLFSCLTDADSLETEKFYAGAGDEDAARRAARRGHAHDLPALKRALDATLRGFGPPETEVNRLRAEVLAAARAAAKQAPGLFSLTVPTGGGKTLTSLAFALDHAIRHGLDRVIYVIPFTSIIEQTAQTFRDALRDEDAILEHHSAFDWEAAASNAERFEQEPDGRERLRLAVENWDRPIIVTTAVQFFESLYSNRKKQCRKLHRLAKSVIVLDEAQTLPVGMLRPCLAAIRELTGAYGASAVLCTATQPAVSDDKLTHATGAEGERVVPEAIPREALREIAPEPERLYEALKRVTIRHLGVLDDDALIARLEDEPQALCIVNNRRHARELFERLAERTDAAAHLTTAHLTTSMCVAHRRAKLAEHRQRLKDGAPIRLIATSLVEAGVDIDFPAVFRAEAGIDSIAQAAGRCNREGRLGRAAGRVAVFAPAPGAGRGAPKEMECFIKVGRRVLAEHADPLSLAAVSAYFGELYWRRGFSALDANGVMALCGKFFPTVGANFVNIATAFQMIETRMVPLIIPERASPFGAPEALLDRLEEAEWTGSDILRRLQQHIVQIPQESRGALIENGAASVLREEAFGQQFVLLANEDLYNDARGLDWSDPTFRDSESSIV